ncbi:hypothetical protein TEA_018413 [Camellia sinensis var. sinensis]|uniref:Oligopeptide transporter 7 n=1 Tax=Camellia sinensis var. sinensis TaxID=542762 RepID=A0A4S4CW23_CAMSN|nr:hypothetical protein TEA_018413 [Camellia sinensis var. sinensis]
MTSSQEISAPLIHKEEENQVDASTSETSPHEPYGEENSPIEQVALTVPVADDQTLPVVTFRMWTLGTLACVLLSFLNQFFWYRKEPLSITSISAQIAVVPLGHLMASTITNRVFFKGRTLEFTLNPGPFNVKEHVLITIFANSGAGNVYAIHVVSAVKVFYRKNLTFFVSLIVVITTQVLGFGWAGMFRRYLVEPAAMWWPANLVQVSLFRELWQQSKSAFQEKKMDVHTKLMRKYKQVPEWWFSCILLMNIASTIFICEYYNDQLQLKWWGVLLACGLALFFTLPIGVITATTNQFEARNHLLEDFKLGHYMKIPPRTMFMAQVVGTLVSALVHLGTAWWLIETIPDICDRALLPPGSPWTCPSDHVFYDASVIWGLIGPRRIFGDLGYYSAINWFFLVGAIAPLLVWLAHKAFPNQQCIRLVTMPVLLHAVASMPPATAVNYTSWIIIGFFSGFVAYRYYRSWWSRHNYVLSGALDAGLAFMAVLLYLCMGMQHIDLNWWGSGSDGCSLASCPTAEGVVIKGCPGYLSEM